jgi:hypothetical protein
MGRHHEPVPAIPDQATKDAVTRRIIDHVRRGWPHLDDVAITFRGQFCYVGIPGPRRRWRKPAPPSPVLRLRYQGHIDRWKIAIYKYSSETYTEAELPTSFGPRTGTPEEGIDHTFCLYAGPSQITD